MSLFRAILEEELILLLMGLGSFLKDNIRHFGGIIAALITLYPFKSEFYWRILFGMGAIGVFPLILLRRRIPESPRWLYFKSNKMLVNIREKL